jgi:hypothetical protein
VVDVQKHRVVNKIAQASGHILLLLIVWAELPMSVISGRIMLL